MILSSEYGDDPGDFRCIGSTDPLYKQKTRSLTLSHLTLSRSFHLFDPDTKNYVVSQRYGEDNEIQSVSVHRLPHFLSEHGEKQTLMALNNMDTATKEECNRLGYQDTSDDLFYTWGYSAHLGNFHLHFREPGSVTFLCEEKCGEGQRKGLLYSLGVSHGEVITSSFRGQLIPFGRTSDFFTRGSVLKIYTDAVKGQRLGTTHEAHLLHVLIDTDKGITESTSVELSIPVPCNHLVHLDRVKVWVRDLEDRPLVFTENAVPTQLLLERE